MCGHQGGGLGTDWSEGCSIEKAERGDVVELDDNKQQV